MKLPYTLERVLDYFPHLEAEEVMWRLKLSSFVSVGKRYMYFEVPKAACTQMKELLRTVEGASPIKVVFAHDAWETRRDMFAHFRSNVPLPSLVELDDTTQREVLESPDFLRMTVVRNPYTRLASAWRGKILLCEPGVRDIYVRIKGRLPDVRKKSLVSFREFVEYLANECDLGTCDPHWRRQADHTFFPALNFSLVAKIERLGEGLRFFEDHLRLPESLVADGKNLSVPVGSAVYTKELAYKVYSLYRRDFEVLGYDGDAWEATQTSCNQKLRDSGLSMETFCDEIIERNLVIASLYEECFRMQNLLHGVSRLRLLWVVKAIIAIRSMSRKLAGRLMAWTRSAIRARRGTTPPERLARP